MAECCVGKDYGNWCGVEFSNEGPYRDSFGREYCVFHAPLDAIYYAEKQADINIIKGEINLNNFNNLIFSYIDRKIEDEEINLQKVIYPGTIDFGKYNKTKILPSIKLDDSEFYGEVYFKGVYANGFMDFRKTKFHERVNFKKAHFYGGTNFGQTEFKKETTFNEAIFDMDVSFNYSKFNSEIYLFDTKFLQSCSWEFVVFEGKFSAIKALFRGLVGFHRAEFKEDCDFIDCNFQVKSDMKSKEINDEVIAKAGVSFYRAKFWKDINFRSSKFDKKVFFGKTIFEDTVQFTNTRFDKKVQFNDAIFKEYNKFERLKLSEEGAEFKNVFIKEKIVFADFPVYKILFEGTDLRRMEFFECEFSPKFTGGKLKLYDEEMIKDETKEDKEKLKEENFWTIKNVEILYRQIKEKGISDHNSKVASDWHYKEKEIQLRRYKLQENKAAQFGNWLYKVSSGYNERFWIAFRGLIILLVTMSLVAVGGFCFKESDWWYEVGVKSLSFIPLLGGKEIIQDIDGWRKIVLMFGQIWVAIQLGLVGITVRNKLRR